MHLAVAHGGHRWCWTAQAVATVATGAPVFERCAGQQPAAQQPALLTAQAAVALNTKLLPPCLQVFLDAIGVPDGSPRRNSLRGIYDRTTFNANVPERSVDLLLLDERYERVPLPCHCLLYTSPSPRD